jgi:hypothetical protein
MRTGEANSSTHNEEAHGAGRHGENVRPVAATSNHGGFVGSLDWVQQKPHHVLRLSLCPRRKDEREGFTASSLLSIQPTLTLPLSRAKGEAIPYSTVFVASGATTSRV